MSKSDYVIRVLDSPLQVDAAQWDQLLSAQSQPTPFMRHSYLSALHQSGSACPATGWTPRFVTLWDQQDQLAAACALYLKDHSYGEYVFDWAWANAYAEHGLAYYPKAVIAVPFTPVPGSRLLARDAGTRDALVHALLAWCRQEKLSSLHLLFGGEEDLVACAKAGLMLRHTVQFHWKNVAPTLGTDVSSLPPEGANFPRGGPSENCAPKPYRDFEDFLSSLTQDKRKKIRQERRKVTQAGVSFRWSRGRDITRADRDFFYRCYERTYLEHGNPPYLSRDFFARMASTLPENWLLFVAQRDGRPIATSLIAVSDLPGQARTAYGRYWGALERVDCLHFEACYYQPLQWCIEHGFQCFEGGAQGEHKMARALLPVKASSAHWLSHPAFSSAVERFLEREGQGVENYLTELSRHSPLRRPD
jgi:predicted N-acyltransferase